jgi:hypothetical protein
MSKTDSYDIQTSEGESQMEVVKTDTNYADPTNWNTAASLMMINVVQMAKHPSFANFGGDGVLQEHIEKHFNQIVDGVFHSEMPADDKTLEKQFAIICAYGLNGYATELKISVEEAGIQVLDTIIGKQRMYGHGNIARFAIPGVAIRLNDKLERLKNLQKHDGPVLFEPINDTWLDICGYSVIALLWIRGWFMLELESEVK